MKRQYLQQKIQAHLVTRPSALLLATIKVIVGAGLTLGMMGFQTGYAQSVPLTNTNATVADATVTGATVRVMAPAQVTPGGVVTLQFRITDATNSAVEIGGFDAMILYPRSAAEFAAFAPLQPVNAPGIGQLVAPELPNGSAVGFYSCATAPCLQARTAQVPTTDAADTTGLVAQVELLALVPGQLEIKLGHLQFVDPQGNPIAVTLATSSITVQVGDATTVHAAPSNTWAWQTVASASASEIATAADVTQDGTVAHSDLMETALAWQIVREDDNPCGGAEAAADINRDGCIDIIDVQLAAAFAGGDAVAADAVASQEPAVEGGNVQQLPEAIFLPQVNGGAGEQTDPTAETSDVLTYTVNSTLDEFDINTGDNICRTASGVCTLRAAIQQASATPGSNIILFAIPGEGVHTIQLTSRLPALRDETGGTVIDGYSQPGATPNTDPLLSNAQLRIELRGDGYDAFDALPITSAGNVIKGLAFYDFKRSVWIYGSGANENVIIGNFIGTNAAGTFAASSVTEEQAHGVHVEQGALSNRIGGVTPAERNVIAGNARHGVGFWHVGTDENVVYNNLVGLSPDGLRRLPNRQQGVDVNYGASFNTVGGTEAGQRNVISGNGENGAEITHGAETTANTIRGNYIGTDVTGNAASAYTSNGGVGISLHDRIMSNLVTDNVISNNRSGGILVDNFGNCCTSNNRIENNRIGVGVNGTAMGNGIFGIHVIAPHSIIGPNNIIAYNPVGIQIEGDDNDGNTITQNSIFSNTGLGIDLAPIGQINPNDADDGDSGPNQQLNFPVIESVSTSQVTGTSCANCRVEIFIADTQSLQYGEGMTFVGAGNAGDDGNFTVAISNVAYGDYLTANATDLDGNTSEFGLNVFVASTANSAPIAVDDLANTTKATPVTIDVLANDSDPEGDPITVTAVGPATHGAVTTDGAFVTYTPTAEFVGEDSFVYTISDGIGGTDVATVTVSALQGAVGEPGITVTPNQLNLLAGGDPVSYTVIMEGSPTEPVTITVIPDAMLVAEPTQLVFTAENWEAPQSVTIAWKDSAITSQDSAEIAAIQQGTVRHSVKSGDSRYNNIGVPTLIVVITEVAPLFMPLIVDQP